jgi:HEAT repeat protein
LRFFVIVGAKSSVIAGCLAIGFLAGCQSGVDGRIARAYSLARHPSEAHKNRIEALLGDKDRDVRATALVVMGGIDKVRARNMALASLADPDGLVRAAAVAICGEAADAETIRLLSAQAIDDPVWHVRARSLQAIAAADDPAVRDAFARALSDPVRHVRRAALIAGMGRPGLLPIDLVAKLAASDTDWENRVEAAIALGASKDPAAYAGLAAAAADPNEFVRTTATRERRELERAGIPP